MGLRPRSWLVVVTGALAVALAMVGCGSNKALPASSGVSSASLANVNLLPFTGSRIYTVTTTTAGAVAAGAITTTIGDLGASRALTAAGISVVITTGDGIFSSTSVTLTSATKAASGTLTIVGTATGTNKGTYSLNLVLSADGSSVVQTITNTATSAVTAATGALSSESGGNTRAGTYVGEAVCKTCHSTEDTEWHTTLHSNAWQTLVSIGQSTNAECVACHTLGNGQPSGFVNYTQTPGLANVQCESCHGPGSAHVAAPSASNITMEVDPATCGSCHTTAQHPTYNEWLQSDHAIALSNVKASGHASNLCITCHSTEGFMYQISQPTVSRSATGGSATGGGAKRGAKRDTVVPPTVTTAQLNVVCWACHDPHTQSTSSTLPNQLRLQKKALCETCHRIDTASPLDPALITASPRHGDGAIFDGTNGLLPNGTAAGLPITGENSWHTLNMPDGCADCHVYQQTVSNPTNGSPNVTGHEFWPNLNACSQSGCHDKNDTLAPASGVVTTATTAGSGTCITLGADQSAVNLVNSTQAAIKAQLALVAPYLTKGNAAYINTADLTASQLNNYNVAVWDYQMINGMDPSYGVHNYTFDMFMLNTALTTLKSLPK